MTFVSFVCGLALALAFPRARLSVLAWVAPVPWLVLLARSSFRSALRLGAAFGLGYFGLLLAWVHGVLTHYTSLSLLLTLPIWLLLVGYLAVFPAAFGGIFALAVGRLGTRAFVLAPVLWVGLEWVRARLLGGFPWGMVGYARAGGLALLQAASVGGIALVSFLIVVVWSSLALLAIRRLPRWSELPDGPGELAAPPPPGPVGKAGSALAWTSLGLVLVVSLLGVARLQVHPLAGRGSGEGFALALVQGGYGSDLDEDQARRALEDYLALSRRAGRSGPDLIVWPESNAPYEIEHDRAYLDAVQRLARETGAVVLLGGVGGDLDTGLRNSAFVVGPEGIRLRYDKRRLVQYGEYVPLKRFFPFVRRFVPESGDFTPGEAVGIAPIGGRRVGVSICYEMIFPEEIRHQARAGADLLVNLTNDSWFLWGGPWQHADFSAVRAIEVGLWTARAASTGRTFLVDPLGREVASGPVGGPALIEARVPAPGGGLPTPYVAWGDWAGTGCVTISALLLAFLGVGNIMDRRKRHRFEAPFRP